jgi:ABC-type multidrug transport system fused ATPase/permease subunit
VRQNINPLDQYCDSELVAALRRCHLAAAINRLGGLESEVGHGGLNLSVGQRQLLCLVRAVLHNAKVHDVFTRFYSVLPHKMHHMTS